MLRMSFYGARDATANWQELVVQEMEKIDFKRGVCNPCTYHDTLNVTSMPWCTEMTSAVSGKGKTLNGFESISTNDSA